ncbi:SCO7613 C-terminal domain-containing membrane protein [Streptomyces sp. NBC_00310]|uniref:SCO7613 C-terminal domain-containing membrane protein n=1 Tax=Streptomyces sp. NBC_00310 TaxID=2903645 RepID=UPI002E23232E
MTHFPSPAEELRVLDSELRQLDARRGFLLARRAWLMNALYAPSSAPPPAAPPVRRPEATAPSVQNVLLILGGVLLTVAAIAFTLVSWGHMGIAGRALVLGAVTVAALGTPVPLLRRGLRSTAETVSGLGLALTVLDAYALHEVAFTGADGTGYAAAASAVLAAMWAAYGLGLGALVPRAADTDSAITRTALGLPLPLALVAAQLPFLLWSFAMNAGVETVTAVVLVTAAADTAIALRVSLKPVRIVAVVGASGWGAWGVLAAGWLSWAAAGPSAAARAAALLALAAAIALTTAWLAPKPTLALGTAVAGGLLAVTGLGGIARAVLPDVWTVPGYLLCGIALLATVRTSAPEPVRRGLAHASAVVQALALATALPVVAIALLGPVSRLERIWSGAPEDARAAVTLDVPWPPNTATVPLMLAVVAGVLTLTARTASWRTQALVGAFVLAWATALVLPAVLELPYTAGLVAHGLLCVATLAFAGLARSAQTQRLRAPLPLTGALLALVTSLNLALHSLATEPVTLTVLAASTVLFAAAAWRTGLGPLTAPASLVHATALTCAIGASAGWEPQHTALLVLAVPAVAALVAARLGASPMTIPVEAAGAAAGLLAIALSATHPPLLALTLALCGVIAAGTAVRPERRAVGYASAALFVLASWVRLAVWEVGSPEAYTLPVTVPALVVGHLRRRRDRTTSSWTAYGPGLAVTLVPSLVAAWGDEHWLRPLLLGSAALAVTLLGARHRLQAPLLLGGAALALVTLHELAPYIAQVVDALPRWVPPALAGLVLLALGATYEQRLRDARRMRDMLGKLG